MKLIRFGAPFKEKPGLQLADGTWIDASGFGSDWTEEFFGGGGLDRLRAWADKNAASAPRVGASAKRTAEDERGGASPRRAEDKSVRLGSCIARPSKIVCIGLNFKDHAAESAMELPKEPVIFFKSTTALVGPNDDLIYPKGGTKVDWEVELAVVIGKVTRYIDKEQAFDHIAGYALHNDYSERAFQIERSGQWVKGKSCDTFAPLGPFLATREEIADPQQLKMWLKVNGEFRQNGTTATMVFDVPTLVSYLSQFMTLLPGDVISTGTPAGVAFGMKPTPVYLKVGDVVELGIEGLGDSRQKVVPFAG